MTNDGSWAQVVIGLWRMISASDRTASVGAVMKDKTSGTDSEPPDASLAAVGGFIVDTLLPALLDIKLRQNKDEVSNGTDNNDPMYLIDLGSSLCPMLFEASAVASPLFMPTPYVQQLPDCAVKEARLGADRLLLSWTGQLRALLQRYGSCEGGDWGSTRRVRLVRNSWSLPDTLYNLHGCRSPPLTLTSAALPRDELGHWRARVAILEACQNLLGSDALHRTFHWAAEAGIHSLRLLEAERAHVQQELELARLRYSAWQDTATQLERALCADSLAALHSGLPSLAEIALALFKDVGLPMAAVLDRIARQLVHGCLAIDADDVTGHLLVLEALGAQVEADAVGGDPGQASFPRYAASAPTKSDHSSLFVGQYAAMCHQETHLLASLRQATSVAGCIRCLSPRERRRFADVQAGLKAAQGVIDVERGDQWCTNTTSMHSQQQFVHLQGLMASHRERRVSLALQGLDEMINGTLTEGATPFVGAGRLLKRLEGKLISFSCLRPAFLPDRIAVLASLARHIRLDGTLK